MDHDKYWNSIFYVNVRIAIINMYNDLILGIDQFLISAINIIACYEKIGLRLHVQEYK
jgi:hypothetical protein